ncbi:AbrB/MazE/SpoVT family DNA-binding domain-containing protein [Candidatus Woesearchaeota archaeon]|nr:AbrB/MazE/SpoVT family DNA-binding domain-containing protein [Candidatus Woesearchaeota archaeon]
MDIDVTKMSSKGQIVIPKKMRRGYKSGEKFIVIRDKDRLILKRATEAQKTLKEDLEFARRTEEAWKRYEKGEFISLSQEEFLKELEKW